MPQELAAIQTTATKIFSHPTWDLILLFVLVAAGFFYGISAGRRKIISSIIYTYVALAVLPAIPIERVGKILNIQDLFFLKGGIFLLLFFLMIFLLSRGGARAFAASGSWWQVFLLSFVQAGLLIHILLSFLPADKIKDLAPLTRTVFANPNFHLWWLLGPLVILVFIRKTELREENRW